MLRDQRGQALAFVLILTTVIFMIGGAAVAMGTAAWKNATLEVWQKKAYYIAEAGVEKALAKLRQKLIYPAPNFEEFRIDDEPYAGGVIEEVTVTKETAGSDIFYTISSSAYYPASGDTRARKSVRVKVKVVPDPFLSYGGPGLKSDTAVHLTGGVTSTGGSLVARTGDVKSQALIAGNIGGIYAGRDVHLTGVGTTGSGEIKAGGDVHLSAAISTWSGEIWAGNEVHGPWWQLGNVTVHEHCGPNIPGFPLPSFPVVDKGSDWYERVKAEAANESRYFESADWFLDNQIQWNPEVTWLIWDYCFVNVVPRLELTGVNVIDGALVLDLSSLQVAYDRWKESYRQQHPGEEIFPDDLIPGWLPKWVKDWIESLLKPVTLNVIVGQSGATIVADSIRIDEGVGGVFGINTSGINGSFGLFAVAGDVVYRAVVGSGGRLSVIATGKFDCATTGNLNLDWVAAKNDVLINALINLNAAQASVPPGTPVGYRIVAWE
ncbi:MAG: hypothetical protein IMW94_00835 [Thermoanaerobacter sp.]|nr:hypothetical protein [Thermoanaerobacter sp.]